MRHFRNFILGISASLLCVCSQGLATELTTFTQGAWDGGAYSDDNSQKFNHCAAAASYNSGLYLIVSVGRDFNWSIGVANSNWNLVPTSHHDLSIRVDGGPWFSSSGFADNETLIELPMSSDSTMIALFRKGHLLEVAGEGSRYSFDLTGTSRLLLLLANCVQDELTAEGGGSPQPDQPVAANESTAAGKSDLITGTGIIVSSDGDILTNNHVIDGCSSIVIQAQNGVPVGASLLFSDRTNDLALLKVAETYSAKQVAAIRTSPAIRAGDTIAVYGYPLAGTLSLSGNIVQGNVSSLAGLGDDARFFQITAPIQPGNSGGPLLDMGGNVTGIVNSKLDEMKLAAGSGDFAQNVNFAIKANVATNFLDAHGVAYTSVVASLPVDLATVADRARPFTVLIVCH